MKTIFHPENLRGHANHGWLIAKHSFSFASWQNREKMNFGALRVLNDDIVLGGNGFGEHPHENMEIITIPLEGALRHQDSMGHSEVIHSGEVQVMSAGTGIQHSEFNPNADLQTKLFQIWLFPKYRNVEPRYQQITLDQSLQKNNFAQILSPNEEDEGVWIYQDAWFYLADFEKDFSKTYEIKKEGNGMYVFVISGTITVNGQELETRDGFGIWDFKNLEFTATSDSKFLIMEIPMFQ